MPDWIVYNAPVIASMFLFLSLFLFFRVSSFNHVYHLRLIINTTCHRDGAICHITLMYTSVLKRIELLWNVCGIFLDNPYNSRRLPLHSLIKNPGRVPIPKIPSHHGLGMARFSSAACPQIEFYSAILPKHSGIRK